MAFSLSDIGSKNLTKSHRHPYGIRSGGVRNPIGRRTQTVRLLKKHQTPTDYTYYFKNQDRAYYSLANLANGTTFMVYPSLQIFLSSLLVMITRLLHFSSSAHSMRLVTSRFSVLGEVIS